MLLPKINKALQKKTSVFVVVVLSLKSIHKNKLFIASCQVGIGNCKLAPPSRTQDDILYLMVFVPYNRFIQGMILARIKKCVQG